MNDDLIDHDGVDDDHGDDDHHRFIVCWWYI